MTQNGPERTCAACRSRRPQVALVRMARGTDGTVHVDPEGKRSMGRGVYLCPNPACLALAEKRQLLRRALKGEVTPQCVEDIDRAMRRLAMRLEKK